MIIISFLVGTIFGIYLVTLSQKIALKKRQNSIEVIYKEIIDNIVNVRFSKRINSYVYLSYKEYEIIYTINKKTVNLFIGDECKFTSTDISEKVSTELISVIESNWYTKIHQDVVNIGGNVYSISFIQEQTNKAANELQKELQNVIGELFTKPVEDIEPEIDVPTIDDILDKINQVGYNNLTQEEVDFLKNNSK